jgi:hypothetical protein
MSGIIQFRFEIQFPEIGGTPQPVAFSTGTATQASITFSSGMATERYLTFRIGMVTQGFEANLG